MSDLLRQEMWGRSARYPPGTAPEANVGRYRIEVRVRRNAVEIVMIIVAAISIPIATFDGAKRRHIAINAVTPATSHTTV